MANPKRKESNAGERESLPDSTNDQSPTKVGADHERIARRAFERFQMRGGEGGRDQEDWFESERELSAGTDQHETE
jgi:hypothetical protein